LFKKINLTHTHFDRIIEAKNISVSERHLQQYIQLCELSESENLPITYPHLLTFNALMTLITDKNFPVPVIGLVHTRNRIAQSRPIPATSQVTVCCFLEQVNKVKKGLECRIVTKVIVADEIYWQSRSDYLYRCDIPSDEINGESQKLPQNDQLGWAKETWAIANNIGRRFASISGDYNPIHLSTFSAKLFGFKRAIAHGMWTKAVALGQLNIASDDIKSVTVEFKQPIYLPAKVNTLSADLAQGKWFKVEACDGEILHLVGEVSLNSALS